MNYLYESFYPTAKPELNEDSISLLRDMSQIIHKYNGWNMYGIDKTYSKYRNLILRKKIVDCGYQLEDVYTLQDICANNIWAWVYLYMKNVEDCTHYKLSTSEKIFVDSSAIQHLIEKNNGN